MKKILLNLTGYTIQGDGVILDFEGNEVGVEIKPFYVDEALYNEESLDLTKGIHTPHLSIESAVIHIYQTYQATIRGNIASCNVWLKTISI